MKAPVDYLEKLWWPIDVDEFWNDLPLKQYDNTPRFECWMTNYGHPYTYGSGKGVRTYEPVRWDDTVRDIRIILNRDTDLRFDCCFINGYPDEKYHLGWHSDDSPEMDLDHAIAIVSFGAPREIWFRRKGDKGVIPKENRVLLGHRSLLLMDAGMQREWEHRIPKHSAPCDKRISLTFRKLVR